ncbi:hypothetical protein GWK47_039223 [Chionoecetes opilio]|uniref:Uncharacterized protein n=1 Tax=Chionoecetes opilio TaxID=41210 RepID=A0A8J5CLQ5_CHIOP|nr:hypothetical protein GWK47_039223 [Chionoecetes opilio]
MNTIGVISDKMYDTPALIRQGLEGSTQTQNSRDSSQAQGFLALEVWPPEALQVARPRKETEATGCAPCPDATAPSPCGGLVLHREGTFTTTAALYQGLVTTITEFVTPSGRLLGSPLTAALGHTPKTRSLLTANRHLPRTRDAGKGPWRPFDAREAMLTWPGTSRTSAAGAVTALERLPLLCTQDSVPTGGWHHVNRARGKGGTPDGDPDPAGRAQELLLQWKGAASPF